MISRKLLKRTPINGVNFLVIISIRRYLIKSDFIRIMEGTSYRTRLRQLLCLTSNVVIHGEEGIYITNVCTQVAKILLGFNNHGLGEALRNGRE